MTAQSAPPTTGPEAILHYLQSMDLDQLEEEQKAIIKSGVKTKRKRAVRLLNIIKGLRANDMKPDELVIHSVPVIPPKFRPFSVTGDTFLPGDANEVYRDLLEYRRLYQDTEKVLGRSAASDSYMDMVRAARAAYGFGESPNPKTKARQVKGFFKMVTGTNPKTSFYQRKMLSKPVDTVGRGVIIPDADLGMDEVGIPEDMAWRLYGNYAQRRLVRSGMTPPAALKHIAERTDMARKALESELPERPVVITRSPAWHETNVIGQRARIIPGDAIKINTFITDGQNADFDGDSVDLDTPIILRRDEELTTLTGRDIQEEFSQEFGNEVMTPEGFEAWTYSGWSRVVNFSLHSCSGKRKYQITLKNGVVFTVSEDHSLMVDQAEVKPADLSPGVRLDTSVMSDAAGAGGTYNDGVIFGHFAGDGCAERRWNTSGRVSVACKPDTEREYLKSLWIERYDCHVTDCGHGWFQITSGDIAQEFLDGCGKYADTKTISPTLMSKSREFLAGMLAGYILADGSVEVTKSGSYLVRTWSRSKVLRDRMSVVASILGLPHSLRQRVARGETNYLISFGKEAIKTLDYRCPGKKGELLRVARKDYENNRSTVKASQSARGFEIKSIEEVEYQDRMIDLEVESGEHVFSIIGGVVLHNTMSVHVPSSPDAVRDVREKMMASKLLWSAKDREKVNAVPKHEQVIGLNMAGLPGGKKRKFATEDEAMQAINSGMVDLNDDIEITG